jgi:hypothetical protein
MTRAIIVTALLIGGAAGPLLSDAAFAQEPAPTLHGTVRRTVDSGMEVVLSRPTFWNSTCNARGVTVTVTIPPTNGGTQIMGKQVAYRSTPGFHGTDVVDYEYVSDWGEKSGATVIITVR